MAVSAFSRARKLPKIKGSSLNELTQLDYSLGVNSYVANDVAATNELRFAQDARISTLGRYITRLGADFYSQAAGETVDDQETSVTGAADQDVTTTTWHAAKFTTTAAGRLTKVELNLKNGGTAPTAPIRVDIYDDSSGSPGSIIASSSVDNADVGGSYAYEVAYLYDAPALANATAYWIVAYLQTEGSGTCNWSSTTNATTAKKSTDSGGTWSATAYDMNFKTYLSTDKPVKGLARVYKSDGTEVTLMAVDDDLYKINDVTGALTAINTSVDTTTSYVRFANINDKVYYVDGASGPRTWDFTTDAAFSGSGFPATGSHIAAHQDLIFIVDATDGNKVVFSNEDDYETAASTNFYYVPSPKSPEPVTALVSLNGVLHNFTVNNKWSLYGVDKATFNLVESPSKKGTFSQESVATTRSHAYFLSDDGVYRFNGTHDELISAKITDKIEAIADKSSAVLAINKNRLYVYYKSAGAATNDSCLVYNLDYGSWESEDTNQKVNRAVTWPSGSDTFEYIVGSAVAGQVWYMEQSGNNYSDAGAPLTYDIRTRYEHYGAPSAKKRPKRWYPRFEAQTRTYNVDCQYDLDFNNSPTTLSTSVGATGTTWGGGAEWGDGSTFGATKLSNPRLTVPGRSNYVQYRIKKAGVNVPVEFIGNTWLYGFKRLR